jgi:chromate reductase
MTTPRLVGLCGSLRRDSLNRKLMMEGVRAFGPCHFTEGNLRLPLYDGDLEAEQGVPPEVQDLSDLIGGADAVLVVTPEYNQAMSGVLKNALDWVSRTTESPWLGKPVALMSATAGRAGGARAQYSLRLAMAPFRPLIVPGPEVLLGAAHQEFDADGRLTGERYVSATQDLMTTLRAAAGFDTSEIV